MRVPQLKKNPKGSQKWVQEIINFCPGFLNKLIYQKLESLSGREIQWTSPLEHDEFSEYRDAASLEAWNSALELQKKLMGLSAGSLASKVIEVFINTNDIKYDH